MGFFALYIQISNLFAALEYLIIRVAGSGVSFSLYIDLATYSKYLLICRRNTSRKAATHCSNGVAAKSIAHVVIQSEA